MKENNFVIIVRTYNSINIISETILSLSKQTYKKFEVVFIDDGSTDGTLEFLTKSDFPFKFVVVSQNHQGPFFGEITGFKNCRDKHSYCLLLDSDDLLFDYTLEKLNNLINSDNPDILFFNYRVFSNKANGECREKYSKSLTLKSYYSSVVPFVVDCFNKHYEAPLSACNHIFKVSMLGNLNYDESFKKIIVGEELIAIFSYLLNAKSIRYYPIDLYLYRSDNPESITKHRLPYFDRYYFIFIGLNRVTKDIENSGLFDNGEMLCIYKIILDDYFKDMLLDSKIIKFKKYKKSVKELHKNRLFIKLYKNRKIGLCFSRLMLFFIKFNFILLSYIYIRTYGFLSHVFKRGKAV